MCSLHSSRQALEITYDASPGMLEDARVVVANIRQDAPCFGGS